MAYRVKIKKKSKEKKQVFELYKRPFHPYEESILRALNDSVVDLTPTEIATVVGIHQVTVKNQIKKLQKKGYVIVEKVGNRMYCKINREKFTLEE